MNIDWFDIVILAGLLVAFFGVIYMMFKVHKAEHLLTGDHEIDSGIILDIINVQSEGE